jgi:hypothetical protein
MAYCGTYNSKALDARAIPPMKGASKNGLTESK